MKKLFQSIGYLLPEEQAHASINELYHEITKIMEYVKDQPIFLIEGET